MSAKGKGSRVRFLATRVVVGGGAVAVFVGFWGAVAATESKTEEQESPPEQWAQSEVAEEPIIQDGWRWDRATGQWVALEPATEAAATAEAAPARQVVIVEQRPVYYVTQYLPVPSGSSTSSNAAPSPAPRNSPTASPASPGATAAGNPVAPAESTPFAVPDIPSQPPIQTFEPYTPPAAAPEPAAPPAPAAAIPAAPPPAAPTPAPAPPPPPPAPAPPPPPPPPAATAAPKSSKGS